MCVPKTLSLSLSLVSQQAPLPTHFSNLPAFPLFAPPQVLGPTAAKMASERRRRYALAASAIALPGALYLGYRYLSSR